MAISFLNFHLTASGSMFYHISYHPEHGGKPQFGPNFDLYMLQDTALPVSLTILKGMQTRHMTTIHTQSETG